MVFSKIQDFPGMVNFYHVTVIQFFKSNWAEIRASAAMFIGKIISNDDSNRMTHALMHACGLYTIYDIKQ